MCVHSHTVMVLSKMLENEIGGIFFKLFSEEQWKTLGVSDVALIRFQQIMEKVCGSQGKLGSSLKGQAASYYYCTLQLWPQKIIPKFLRLNCPSY